MKIALITDGIWPYVLGGMQKHSFYLCKYLAQNGVQVTLVHFNQSSYNIEELSVFSAEEKKNIRSVIVPMPKSAWFPGAYIFDSYKHSRLVFRTLGNSLAGFDFIYTKGFTGWYLINQKHAGKIKCAGIGVKFHGYEMFQRAPSFKTWLQHLFLLRYPVKQISQRADVVFSYGGKITEILWGLGITPQKIVEIPSGVEKSFIADRINETKAPVKFLFLGRYERRKGIEELNQAIKRVLKNNPAASAIFNFIGPIPDQKKLSHSKIIYHGEVRDKESLQALIEANDVLLCPSWSEGLPNSILEAMARGLAVVATDVGAVGLAVNENTGWLLKSSSVHEIEAAINHIIKLPVSEIDIRKENAIAMMRNRFNWEVLSLELIEAMKHRSH